MPTIALIIEYDGSEFHGWQIQPGLRTVQGVLTECITTILRSPIGPVLASGRTDAGVCARAQVVTFSVSHEINCIKTLALGISHLLKGEVSVRAAAVLPAPFSFDPRRDAVRKRYEYLVSLRSTPPALGSKRMWWRRGPLQREVLSQAAQHLIGTHDFKSFQGAGAEVGSTVRTVFHSAWDEVGEGVLRYSIEGDGFLKQMVRTIVGSIIQMAEGALLCSMEQIIQAHDRTAAGITAPAHGLSLQWVEYQWFRSDQLFLNPSFTGATGIDYGSSALFVAY